MMFAGTLNAISGASGHPSTMCDIFSEAMA